MASVEKMVNEFPEVMEQWSETVLQNVSDAIIAVDRSWQVVYANPSAERLLRATQAELIGSPLKYCVPHVVSGTTAPISLDQLLNAADNRNSRKSWNITDRLGQQHELQCQVFKADRFIDTEHAAVIFLRFHEQQPANKVSHQKSSGRDSLTGLVDRFTFAYEFRKILARAEHSRQPNQLCSIDLSQLAVINEVCGLAAGDELLKQVAKMIQRHLEKPDLLCRFSGNNFLLLYSGSDVQQATHRMNTLLTSLMAYRFVWDNHSYSIGVHIGITSIDGHSTVDKNITDALSACAAAKQGGNNLIHVHGTPNQFLEQRQADMLWVDRITHALDNDGFFLFGQSIERTENQNKEGSTGYLHFEVLVRMFDSTDHSVAPGHFLPAAERFGLIEEIDKWVVKNTLRWLSHHNDILNSLDCCSINLSGKSMSDHRFLDFVLDQFRKFEVPAEKICFEITETAVISNLSNALTLINSLREFGCKFALDDFGSGLSSFAYLKKFPIDFLKIDGLFVQDVCEDSLHRALVKSINDIGKEMGFSTIAEFVEDDETRQCLDTIGVDLVQGYGISRPRPLNELCT